MSRPVQRPVRVVEPEQHAGVDVLGAADAFAQRERRLVDELADDPPEHEPRARRPPTRRACPAWRTACSERSIAAVGRRRAAGELDEPAGVQRRQRVEPGRRRRRGRARPASPRRRGSPAARPGAAGRRARRRSRGSATAAPRPAPGAPPRGTPPAPRPPRSSLGQHAVPGDDEHTAVAAADGRRVGVLGPVRPGAVVVVAAPGLAPVAPGRDQARGDRWRAASAARRRTARRTSATRRSRRRRRRGPSARTGPCESRRRAGRRGRSARRSRRAPAAAAAPRARTAARSG